jgi:hypothetical protein
MRTFEEWVNIANEIYNNKYKYKQIYKNNKYYYFKINCEKHGDFEKRISNHIDRKQGCPTCAFEHSSLIQRNTTENFILKSKEIHGDKYDYSLSHYKDAKTKIKIICKEHGIFEQLPCNHYKQNCPKCCKTIPYNYTTFCEKSNKKHNNKYCYDNSIFIDCKTPIKILCKEHGYFLQNPRDHLNGNGCYKCCGKIKNTEDFVEKATKRQNYLYDYSKVNYINAREKVCIICKIHGDFLQSPNDHLNGRGCQKCGLGNYSKVCINWLNNLMINDRIFIQHAENLGEKQIIINGKNYKCDGYCKETNTIYEFYGDIWHGNPNKYNKDDFNILNKKTFGELYQETINREKILKENGYNLITIWESEFNK